MTQISIYFRNQNSEQEKIQTIVDRIESKYDIHITNATIGMIGCAFEFPVIEIESRLYGYKEGLSILDDLESEEESS